MSSSDSIGWRMRRAVSRLSAARARPRAPTRSRAAPHPAPPRGLQTCTLALRAVQGAVPAVFELQGVAHRFGRLGPLDLRVAEGETLAVLGPSGAGKTTLLRLLLGLLAPDQGTVRFRGEDVRALDPAALRRRIGYVVQGGGLFPHLTAEGNVTLVARWLKWPEERIARRLDELLHLARLPEAALQQY